MPIVSVFGVRVVVTVLSLFESHPTTAVLSKSFPEGNVVSRPHALNMIGRAEHVSW